MKTLERLKADPRVDQAWSEAGTGDGYWIILKPGFADLSDDPCQPTHTIHEWRIADILRRMRDVKPCACKECKS